MKTEERFIIGYDNYIPDIIQKKVPQERRFLGRTQYVLFDLENPLSDKNNLEK